MPNAGNVPIYLRADTKTYLLLKKDVPECFMKSKG